ncbi:MAG: PAS domain S-box protein [Anaerolineae bacterium]
MMDLQQRLAAAEKELAQANARITELEAQLANDTPHLSASETLDGAGVERGQRGDSAAELEELKHNFDTLLGLSSDGIVLLNPEQRIQVANGSFMEMFGLSDDDYIDQKLSALVHTDDAASLDTLISEVVSTRQTQSKQVRARHANGTAFDVKISVSVSNVLPEAVTSLVCVIQGIILKETERTLRYYASLQASVSDAVIATDMDFHIQSWNRAAEAIYGWSEAEVVGKSASQVLKTAYETPADRERALQNFLAHGYWQSEIIQYRKDGTPLHIHASVNLFKDDKGVPFGVVSVNRDITQRKQADTALQKWAATYYDLYNKAPCGYHSLDQNGVIIQINDTELDWLGYSREEVIGQRKITDFYTLRSIEIFRQNFSGFKERGFVSDLEFELIRRDGSIMPILVNSSAVYDEHGEYLSSRSVVLDITELKKAQQAAIESEARYSLLVNNVRDYAIFSLDVKGNIITWSQGAEFIKGYSGDEIIGRNFSLFYPPERSCRGECSTLLYS